MRTIKVFISYIMVFAILLTIIPFNAIQVKAAITGNNLTVQSYRYNSGNGKYELTVSWQGAKSTKSANIAYNSDDAAGTLTTSVNVPAVVVDSINLTTSRFSATFDVSSLNEDFLYDIKVTSFDTLDNSGTIKMSGDIYFITGITFDSERVDQTLLPGVFESGTSPELKLSWKVPKVWNGSAWVMSTDPTAISTINSILKPAKDITKLDFKINISTKAQLLDSGADISPVFIQKDMISGTYISSDSSGTPKPATTDPVSETMSVNIVGRKDLNETPVFDPSDTRLYHNQIQPGTVYFMNIKPNFIAGTDLVDAVTLGDPTQLNGSLVRDKASGLGYTYTPVRFKITRDASDNVYVTAYRINKDDGSVDMPNLYYSIQAIDTPILTYGFDWPEKARMTDQFFPTGSQYAVTVITGVDVNTPMYYKVVVKTDSKADRIESLMMRYQMSSDTSKPPIPVNVKVDMTQSTLATGNVKDPATGSVIVDQYNNPVNVRTTDILLTWDKPANFESMSAADKADLVYHVAINTNVENLKLQYPLKFAGLEREYLINYRWVKAISATDPKLKVDGNKLTYRIKGFELFRNTDGTPVKDPDKYPQWLIENTIYYIKMFTTKTLDASELATMSDLTGDGVIDEKDFSQYAVNSGVNPDNVVSQSSVISSFTTLPGTDKQVPVPTGFKATGENVNTITKKNYINLQFDRSIIDWNVFTSTGGNKEVYELFMAPGSGDDPQYIQIGSTDPSFTPASSEYTKAQITLVNGVWTVLVPDLRQNTTYRFKLRLKLDFGDSAITDMYSEYTAMVSVTTRKIEIVPPQDASKMPRAPVDFNIGKTSDGSLDLNGTGVGLDWTILEDDVSYQLVATSSRIAANADISEFSSDAYYQTFINRFGAGPTDNVNDLNPVTPGGNFDADLIEKNAKYRIENFMVPNNIYFYSLRAMRTVYVTDPSTGNVTPLTLYSQWITVPVTTSMIEAPLNLETVMDYELGVTWEDSTAGTKPTDYKLYIKKSNEATYKPLDITKATIIKDNDGKTFYGRITGLEAGTEYNLGALKGTDTSYLNFEKTWTLTTRDEYHNVEVRWKGIPGFTYEIAMRNEGTGEDYVNISSADFELKPEKSQEIVGTGYYYYYARIKKMPVKLSDGTYESFDLASNTKYYIKVRSTSSGVQPSNYTGPVMARTSFKQSDYDDNENIENVKSKLVDKIDELEKKPYYSLNYVLSTTNTLLLKGDRLAEELKTNPYHEIEVDLTNVSSVGRRDVVYIPEYLAQTLRDSRGSISFVLDKAEYTLVSSVLDESRYSEAADLRNSYNEKEMWYKLTISRPEGGTEGIDADIKAVSPVNVTQLEMLGVSQKYSDLKKDYVDKIYNSETGLVKKQKDKLQDMYTKNPGSVTSQGDYLTDILVAQVEEQLADYVRSTIEGGSTAAGIILASRTINEFYAPVIVKLYVTKTSGYLQPYGLYTGGYSWSRLNMLNSTGDAVSFEMYKPGKYFIGEKGNFTDTVPESHWANATIIKFNSKYNIADIFNTTESFNPDTPISIKDSILIMDKVFNSGSIKGESLQKKISRLGLSAYFGNVSPVKDLAREQAATIYMKTYSNINGLSIDAINPNDVIAINDSYSINKLYYKNAENAVSFGFMVTDQSGAFNPGGYVTRAEFISAMDKALTK